jgi:hypothetical protein
MKEEKQFKKEMENGRILDSLINDTPRKLSSRGENDVDMRLFNRE